MHLKKDMEHMHRLKKIEGQVRGVIRMMKDDRDCEEIIVQLIAIRSGITRLMIERLKERLIECLKEKEDGRLKEDFSVILDKALRFLK